MGSRAASRSEANHHHEKRVEFCSHRRAEKARSRKESSACSQNPDTSLNEGAGMKNPHSKILILTVACAFSAGARARLPTTGSIGPPLGKLDVVNGYPTPDTVKKLCDSMDFQRAVQAYLWALPHVAMGQTFRSGT
jgi:hypothetical protein